MLQRLRQWAEKLSAGSALSRRRAVFSRERAAVWVEDEEFVRELLPKGSPVEHTIATLLRNIVADECGIPPQMVLASDKPHELLVLMGPSVFVVGRSYYDYLHVRSCLERDLGRAYGNIRIDRYVRLSSLRSFGDKPGDSPEAADTLGGWILGCMAESGNGS
jgi:hypothetical protein